MDNDSRTPRSTPSYSDSTEQTSYAPYRRDAQQAAQGPISNDGAVYRRQGQQNAARGTAMPSQTARYSAAERQAAPRGTAPRNPTGRTGSGRQHMGVATSDPQYLQPVETDAQRPSRPAHPRHKTPGDGTPQTLHSGHYLSTPPGKRAIFTQRQTKVRRRKRILIVLAILIVIAIIVWVVFFS